MDPQEIEELVKLARSRDYSDKEIQQILAKNGIEWEPPRTLKEEIRGGSASFLQGVSLNAAGLISPELKKAAERFRKEHKVLGPAMDIAGSVTSGLALPVGLGAGALTRALVGGGAGAIASAAGGEGSLEERAKRGAVGGAVGAVGGAAIPAVVGGAVKIGGRFVNPRFRPGATNAKAVGPLLPDNAEQIMARQEALAPGASTAAGLDPSLPQTTRVIGADPALARKAAGEARKRLDLINSSMRAFKPRYDAILKGKSAPLVSGGVNIGPVLTKNGLMPINGQIGLSVVQRLRHDYANKMVTAKGMKKGELVEEWAKLNEWLHKNAPDIKAIDSEYAVLKGMKKAETEVVKNLGAARGNYATSRAAGIEPGSPGAKLPTNSGLAQELLHPSRENLGRAAYDNLLQPGRIPGSLLRARDKAMGLHRFDPELLTAFGLGAQSPALTGGLLGD